MASAGTSSSPKHVFDHVSLKARLIFYGGVFCLFAPFSLIYDLASPANKPWPLLAAWSLYSGATAVGFAYAFTRDLRFLWFNIPFSFLVGSLFGHTFYDRDNVQAALFVEAGISIVVMVLGYILFVVFISGEGAQTIRLRTEINLAKEIHDHLVPKVDLKTSRLEVFGISLPASEFGGDLMDVRDTGAKTGLYVADVMGHGVPAGVSMGMLKSAIRMKLRDEPPLSDLVSSLNDVFVETQRSGTLATIAAIELSADGTAVYALAGHLPILRFRPGLRTAEALPNEYPPLGVLENKAFGHVRLETAPGDLFVILTDGLTEVFNRAGEEFGHGRIEAVIGESRDRPLAEIYTRVLAAVRAFGPQIDDQTLLMVRVT